MEELRFEDGLAGQMQGLTHEIPESGPSPGLQKRQNKLEVVINGNIWGTTIRLIKGDARILELEIRRFRLTSR